MSRCLALGPSMGLLMIVRYTSEWSLRTRRLVILQTLWSSPPMSARITGNLQGPLGERSIRPRPITAAPLRVSFEFGPSTSLTDLPLRTLITLWNSTRCVAYRADRRSQSISSSNALSTVEFDYYACLYVNGSEQCGWGKPGLHNFARLRVETLDSTIRCSGGGNNGESFKTILGRARARSPSGYMSTRAQITKLYALDGTNFYNSLGSCPTAKTGNSTR